MEPFIYYSPEFQKELADSSHLAGEVNFLASIGERGMRAIDAGAHRGVTAVALANKIDNGGHVYAFEPVPEFYTVVKEKISRNCVDNVSSASFLSSGLTVPQATTAVFSNMG